MAPATAVTNVPPPGDPPAEVQLLERPDYAAEMEGLELFPIRSNPSRAGGEMGATISTHPFNPRTIALLMPAAVIGLLVRLGIEALATYPNQSIFSLAWVQAAGCLAMGVALGLRETISE